MATQAKAQADRDRDMVLGVLKKIEDEERAEREQYLRSRCGSTAAGLGHIAIEAFVERRRSKTSYEPPDRYSVANYDTPACCGADASAGGVHVLDAGVSLETGVVLLGDRCIVG